MEIEAAVGSGSSSTAAESYKAVPSVDDEGGGDRVMRGSYLVWEDLTVMLPNFRNGHTKSLLLGLRGFAEPGRIMAIMGPSGSGKSTLLDSLAGRLSKNVVMTGNVLFNGKKRSPDCVVAYVTQEDVLLGTLTARETIYYSANLRLPSSMTKDEINGVVEGTLTELGLHECADRLVGNWHLRGLSGGEKKRLSIALEILTRPQMLFLDEPTSGLDSASAFSVTHTLRNIARDGRTVISSIHQPSSEVFALFDDLYLLSGGVTVYFGEAKKATEFFAEAGFPCPSRSNPSDHFLRCINTDFDAVTATLKGSLRLRDIPASADPFLNLVTAEIKARLVEKYRRSNYAKRAKERIKQISAIKGLETASKRTKASWGRQLSTLTRRSSVNMSRDAGYYWARIVIYIVVSICVGTMYYDIGYGYTSIIARIACGGFITGFMTFMSIGGFPSFIEEMKVFYREKLNGYYGVSVFILSNFFSSLPFLISIAAATGSICFYMVKFRSGFSYYLFFCLNIFACISVIESMMMVVASLVPNFLMGLVTGAGIIGIMMMTCGFFRRPSDLPKVFWRYPISYMNYGAWGFQGDCKNFFLGLEFDPLVVGEPKIQGEYVASHMIGVTISHSKWWDLAAIYLILVCCRILFFVVLKLKEIASPLIKDLYSKRTLQILEQRPSFRKMTSFESNRSLSSQEGLNSPLH